MTSIRHRLLAWLLSALLSAGLAATAMTYFQAKEDVGELFDYELRQIAASMRHQQIPHPPPAENGFGDEEDNEAGDFVVQVWDQHGALVYASHPDVALPRFTGQGLSTPSWHGQGWRVYVAPARTRTVQVAQPMSARREMAAKVALRILIPILILIPVLGIVIWISVGRGLRPLTAISAALATRNPGAMEPLPERGLPGEVKPLVRALNDLLSRLGRAMETQRRFIADAAHELRTPLTAVQLQLQLLARADSAAERESALSDLTSGVQRAIHLVQQLLMMARIEPDISREAFRPVALDDVVNTVAAEYAPLALDKKIDLGVVRSEPAMVRGDAENLRVLVGNLVDNGIRYTPSGGSVDLSVYASDSEAVLEVEDTGPGIPPEERSRVFDRFYRALGSGVQGSGLGLAIVKSIVERHGGSLSLASGKTGRGLKLTVRLKLA